MLALAVKIIFLYLWTFGDSKHICATNHSAEIKLNEVAFIESPNFPQLMDDTSRSRNCLLDFSLSNNTISRAYPTRGFLVITNAILSYNGHQKFNVFKNTTKISFNNIPDYISEETYYYQAYQGFVVFDYIENDCPLESISRVKPFHFTDESQIIYIQSSFDIKHIRNHPCLWQFTATKNYGFKLVIEELNIEYPTQLNITNSTHMLNTERSAEKFFAYYNSDNYLKITLSKISNTSLLKLEFAAYLSIINNTWQRKEILCNLTYLKENFHTWSNINGDNAGYGNNQICTLSITIDSNTELIAHKTLLSLEENVDLITFNVDNSTTSAIYTNSIRASGYKNGTERDIVWQFMSDGSINLLGFTITFEGVYCKCMKPIIKICNFLRVLDNIKYKPRQPYCGNLKCNYTLERNDSCNFDILYIRFSSSFFAGHADIYKIYSNNSVALEINTKNQKPFDYYHFLSPNNENILEIDTDMSLDVWYSKIRVSAVATPHIWIKLNLSKENPYAELDTSFLKIPKLNTFLIEINQQAVLNDACIEIYSNTKGISLSFYSDETFEQTLNFVNCFVDNTKYTYQCKKTKSKLLIYPPPNSLKPFLFFQLSTEYSIGCVFKQNVFTLPPETMSRISRMANDKGVCRIFILLGFDYNSIITNLFTTSKTENVKVYAGASNRKLFFQFNSKTSSNWKYVILNSRIYMFEIPKGTSLLMTVAQKRGTPTLDVMPPPYQTVFSTADYRVKTDICGERFQRFEVIFNVTNMNRKVVKITVLDYKVSIRQKFFFMSSIPSNVSSQSYKVLSYDEITHINQTFIYSNFFIVFFGNNDLDCPSHSDLLFYLEVIDSDDIVTTTPTSRSDILKSSPLESLFSVSTVYDTKKVPICREATLTVKFINSTLNKLIYVFSIDMSITYNSSIIPYSNLVILSNFSYWSSNEALYYDNKPSTWCYNGACIYFNYEEGPKYRMPFPDGTVVFRYFIGDNGRYDYSSYFADLYFDNGQIFDRKTLHLMNPENFPCIIGEKNDSIKFNADHTVCCTKYDYVAVPASLEYTCQTFEINSEITENDIIQIKFTAEIAVSSNGIFVFNNEFSSLFYDDYEFTNYFKKCKNNSEVPGCGYGYTIFDRYHVYNLIVFNNSIALFYANVAKFVRKNGMILKIDHTPFTSTSQCWREKIPIPINVEKTIDTSFCCVKFISEDKIKTTPSKTSMPFINSKTILPPSKELSMRVTIPSNLNISLNASDSNDISARIILFIFIYYLHVLKIFFNISKIE